MRRLTHLSLFSGIGGLDLSEAIGYDASIINAWEIGRYHMADLQKKAINDYFHRDIFAEATATA